jgi:lysine 6-dehydrogenase
MTTHPSFHFLILGAGRQGTAAAYDLARFGDAAQIVLADADLEVARQSAERVNRLVGRPVAHGTVLDVTDKAALKASMAGVDVALSAVPYYYNLDISRVAIDAGVHLCDMGGNTDVVRSQIELSEQARQAGISLLPDCGMGPGLINVLACFAMEQLDETREIFVYDGGLPQDPQPPWNYQCAFHINGLTNEYDGDVPLLRDGQIVNVPALSECQMIDLSPFGTFETFIAAGGSTAPWTFHGILERFETRIMRYPGHYAWFKGFQALGLFGQEPIRVGSQMVVPRDVYHALLVPRIQGSAFKDRCYMRCKGIGVKDGKPTTAIVDLIDVYDESTRFTGMERLTGWHCAIMMIFQARGVVPAGAKPIEQLLLDGTPSAQAVMDEVARRGIKFEVRQTIE